MPENSRLKRQREVEFISKKAEKKEKKRYSLEQMD